jgi:prepilin-type N-terminal cleavage/methylation domain-containing protein
MRRGFSLIELVIVIVIIGIIAAIAIPRMSRGAEGAAESSLRANLAVLRNAIDLFHTEHEGLYPKVATFEAQLTTYSNIAGGTSATKTTTHVYGPYLRAVPDMPVKGQGSKENAVAAAAAAGVGWVYTEATGVIRANSTENGSDGTAFNTW